MSRQFSEDMKFINHLSPVGGNPVISRLKKLKREHAAMKKYLRLASWTNSITPNQLAAAWNELLKKVKL